MNLLSGLTTGLSTLLETGNPLVAAGAGALGAFGGTSTGNLTGALGNTALDAMDAQNEAFQVAMYGEQIRHSEVMQTQSQTFDEMMDEKSEQMREVNTLRDVQLQQRKADDATTKKFIESITE